MGRTLPAVGTVSYNGFTWPAALHSSASIRPVFDRTGRTVKYFELTLRIDTYITSQDSPNVANTPIDTTVYPVLFSQLTTPGKRLYFQGQGLGSIIADWTTDYAYGPTPKVVTWEPVGSNQAVHVVWEVVATGTICPAGAVSNVVEFSIDMRWSIDEEGMTQRTITGYLETLVQRQNDPTRTGNPVDTQRSIITIPRLDNFQRTTDWHQSPDKRGEDFVFVDTEIPSDNPYLPNMVKMDVKERLAGGLRQGGLKQWDQSIHGTIKIAPGVPRAFAWLAFQQIIASRLSALTSVGPNKGGDPVTAITPVFSFENEIYGRTLGFSIAYIITVDLQNLLAASGIWRPVPGSWKAWSTSMESIQGIRGIAGLGTIASDDIIIDPCHAAIGAQSVQTENIPGNPYQPGSMSQNIPGCPPQSASWLRYQNTLSITRETNTIIHTPANGSQGDSTAVTDPSGVTANSGGSITASPVPQNGKIIIQDRGVGSAYLIMEGYAVRVGFKIPIPKVLKIGNNQPVLDSEDPHFNTIIGWAGDCPIYATKWRQVYIIPGTPNGQQITVTPPPQGIPNQGL